MVSDRLSSQTSNELVNIAHSLNAAKRLTISRTKNEYIL